MTPDPELTYADKEPSSVRADVVVVGTGPAGAAASALLATYAVDTLTVSKYGWTSRTPRSHITNQRTMEVLRDLGLEDAAVAAATHAS